MPNLNLKAEVLKTEDGTKVNLLRAVGFVDSSTFHQLDEVLEALRDDPAELILHFAGVEYINSSGIALLIQMHHAYANTGRELVLAEVRPAVARIMSMLGIYSAGIKVFKTTEDSLAYLRSAPYGKRKYAQYTQSMTREAAAQIEPPKPKTLSVLVVAPEENRFVQVLRHRLQKPEQRFQVVTNCRDAEGAFDSFKPDAVILEDDMEGSEEFVRGLKLQPRKSVVPLIRLYLRGTDLNRRRELKVWEDDHLLEPFELQELFAIAESELRRFAVEKERLFSQTHVEFNGYRRDDAENLIGDLLKNCGLSAETLASFRQAVKEAIDNAIRHGHKGEPDKTVDVVIKVEGNMLSVTIEDEGPGFNYNKYLANLGDQAPPPKGRGGLGIYLMYKATEGRLTFEGPGNRVRLQTPISNKPA